MPTSPKAPHCPIHSPYMESDDTNFLILERTKEWTVELCVECLQALQHEWRRKEQERIRLHTTDWWDRLGEVVKDKSE